MKKGGVLNLYFFRSHSAMIQSLGQHHLVEAWCDGYRRAWCAYYSHLPTTDRERALLEFELERAVTGKTEASDQGGRLAHPQRPQRVLH